MEAESGAVIGTTCHVRQPTCWSILLTSEKLMKANRTLTSQRIQVVEHIAELPD
jgi:hypothetical protein